MMHHGRSGGTHVPATIRSIIYLYLYLNLPPAGGGGFRVEASNPRAIGIAARPRLHFEMTQNSELRTHNSPDTVWQGVRRRTSASCVARATTTPVARRGRALETRADKRVRLAAYAGGKGSLAATEAWLAMQAASARDAVALIH